MIDSPTGEVIAPAPPLLERPAYTLWDVLRIALVSVLAVMAFSVIAIGIGSARYGAKAAESLSRNPAVVLPAQFLGYAATLAYMVALVRARRPSFWRAIEWNFPSGALAFIGLGVVLSIAIQAASLVLPFPKELPVDKYFSSATGAYLMAIFGITVAPLMEELFFRGFLFPALARHTNRTFSLVFTALSFAMMHEAQLAHAWAPLLMLFVVGMALTYARARTGSVAVSFLMHVGYNLAIFTLLWFGSDHFRHISQTP